MLMMFLLANATLAQDTTYFRNYFEKVTDPTLAEFYTLVTYEDADSLKATKICYYMNDKIKSVTPYSNIKWHQKHGVQSLFYENGALYSTQRFVKGKAVGLHHVFYPDATIKREDYYKKNELKKGNCYGIDGSDTTYFAFEKMPQFPGGDEKLLQFMAKNTKYPPLARENNVQGIVVISFLVTKTGSIEKTRVERSISDELDAECIRVVSLLPDFEPAEMDGEKVAVQVNLPFRFTLR